MNIRSALVVLLVVALASVSLGFIKKTGSAWFTDWDTGNEIKFSVTAQTLEPLPEEPPYWVLAKGNFQLFDKTEKTSIHGHIDTYYYVPTAPEWSDWDGECSVNGADGYYFYLFLHDEDEPGWPGEWVWLLIYENQTHKLYREYWLDREKGDIKNHED